MRESGPARLIAYCGDCVHFHAASVRIERGRDNAESPENGSFSEFGWRLFGIFGPEGSNISLWRLSAMIRARIWRAFLIEKRKFSKTKDAWLGQQVSN